MLLLTMLMTILLLKALVLENLLVKAQEASGNIISGPHNQTVAQGETAHFNCHAVGTSVAWYINGSLPDPWNNELREFNFTYVMIVPHSQNQLGEENNTITVVAHASINNTRIKCKAQGQAHGPSDDVEVAATLIIIGSPSAPTFNLIQQYAGNGLVQHVLLWTVPFSWPGFPITHYTITIHNFGNGDTSTVIKSNKSLTHTHTTQNGNCYRLDFSLAATNAVGKGERTITHTGNPIVPDVIEDIETTAFYSNNISYLKISFLAPRICPEYQTGNFSITVYNSEDHLLRNFGPEVYIQDHEENKTLIEMEIPVVLNQGEFHQVVVTSESIGVSVSKNITLLINTVTRTQDTAITENDEVTTTRTFLQESKVESRTPATIAGAVFGVTSLCILTTMVLIITVTCVLHSKKRSQTTQIDRRNFTHNCQEKRKTRALSLKMQNSNPMYEGSGPGPVYEPVPGESLKYLLSPGSTPTTPQADCAIRYRFDSDLVPSLQSASNEQLNLKLADDVVDLSLQPTELPSDVLSDKCMVMHKSFPKDIEISNSASAAVSENIN